MWKITLKGNEMEKTFRNGIIKFSELSPDARQQFCNWTYKGKVRHLKDLAQIDDDLEHMKWKYNLTPEDIYQDWIEVKE
jgi:hypothetical protein